MYVTACVEDATLTTFWEENTSLIYHAMQAQHRNNMAYLLSIGFQNDPLDWSQENSGRLGDGERIGNMPEDQEGAVSSRGLLQQSITVSPIF
jgi:hypothetical protein